MSDGQDPSGDTTRALVVVGRPAAWIPADDERPMAGFVTQLIACARRLPAYRQSRRAEPAEASGRYGRTVARSRASLDLTV